MKRFVYLEMGSSFTGMMVSGGIVESTVFRLIDSSYQEVLKVFFYLYFCDN
ncbi:hypothetical protein [Rummeliibacillus suwonensis]|uniref:hypothetical protein n=1 Tax=Rummeliibacillus suwonensis TaxID=1306154 RepID=UPI00289E4598|nr:hypothetical protein [Rummeliibacillus suwonensis]